jgi:hypothetical protein
VTCDVVVSACAVCVRLTYEVNFDTFVEVCECVCCYLQIVPCTAECTFM